MKRYSNEQIKTRIQRTERLLAGSSANKAIDPRKAKRALRIIAANVMCLPRLHVSDMQKALTPVHRKIRYGTGSIAA
jgi:hypothetical protein